LNYTDFAQLRNALESGEITVSDVVEHYIQNVEDRNDEVNAVVSIDKKSARKRAGKMQQRIDEGKAGRLAGLVVGIKDIICVKDETITAASNILSNFESVYDATVIKRLRAEDAILLGRLNMDEFAMGSTTSNSIHGATRNPLDTTKIPGGSSGGSAAAVAADFCTASLGSDTGGSIRQPAAYCGLVGLKPTYGRVSRYGLVATASSFDTIGPLAHTVEDAALLLEVLAGYDEKDNTSSSRPVPNYRQFAQNPDANIRIGVPEGSLGNGLDYEIRESLEERLSGLEQQGAELVPIELPHIKHSVKTYYALASAEASSNMARYDGIRYGHRADIKGIESELSKERESIKEQMRQAKGEQKAELNRRLEDLDSSLIRLYKKSRGEGFGEKAKRRIMLGTYVLSTDYYDDYFIKAQKVRRLIKQELSEAYEDVDVIAAPTTPSTAFNIDVDIDDPVEIYRNDVYTTAANLAGICAINVPAGTHSNGLPYGMQFMADTFEEGKLLNAARLIEQLRD